MIDYEKNLNVAQFNAVTAADGPVLVIAGAGSGKTRTIVYRLAWLCEKGVEPHNILLLTFTRKAAQEMLERASLLLERGLSGVMGGTFHAFAYGVLRQYRPQWLEGRNFSIMDSADISSAIAFCKEKVSAGKGERSFPKNQNIASILSKARNKELSIEEILKRESAHLLMHANALEEINAAYMEYRRQYALLDYDDLLFELEALLKEDRTDINYLRTRYQHIMVDEYQDTNLVQARIVHLLGGKEFGGQGNVMAVGDDAQSIYAFRGANVRNILDFSKHFPQAKRVSLEENYRSTQAILDVANNLLQFAKHSYDKKLFTSKEGGELVKHIQPANDKSQAEMVVARVKELLQKHLPHEIAVLFRAGFHSYQIEVGLQASGIAFRKYGGIRFSEASHIKDILSYARLIINIFDMVAFERVAMLYKGIGKKTMLKLYNTYTQGDTAAINKAFAKFRDLLEDLQFLEYLRKQSLNPDQYIEQLLQRYQPRLENQYPDDWPRRVQGLERIQQMASEYDDLDLFIANLVLDTNEEKEEAEQCITLSTIHSAKGLEWNAVLIIDLVEDRFPSRHASSDLESFEEERRLMYVACTRARQCLELYVPSQIYMRGSGAIIATPSPFISEFPQGLCEQWYESYNGRLHKKRKQKSTTTSDDDVQNKIYVHDNNNSTKEFSENNYSNKTQENTTLGYCHHKIFGRGKLIKFLPPDKYQVNFLGFGIKTILKDFLIIEE